MKAKCTFAGRPILFLAIAALVPGYVIAAQQCEGDPFASYHEAFRGDGPEYECVAARTPASTVAEAAMFEPAEGPAPMVREQRPTRGDDPFAIYRNAFTAD